MSRGSWPLVGAVVLVVNAVQWVVAEAVGVGAWTVPPYSYATNYISDLGVPDCGTRFQGRAICSPLHALVNASFVTEGVLFAAGVVLLSGLVTGRARRVVVVLALLHGVGMVLVGLFHGSANGPGAGLVVHVAGGGGRHPVRERRGDPVRGAAGPRVAGGVPRLQHRGRGAGSAQRGVGGPVAGHGGSVRTRWDLLLAAVERGDRHAAAGPAGAAGAGNTGAPGVTRDDGRPLRADAERNRQLVLRTADRLFSERGFGVTLNEIAHAAGIGVGTVYRRFPDLQALVDTLFTERFTAFQRLAGTAAAEPDPGRALRRYLLDAAAWRARDRALEDILANASIDAEPIARMRDDLGRAVDELVRRAVEAGAVRADFASADVYTFLFITGAVADRTRDAAPEAWRRYADVLLAGFGLAPADPPSSGAPPMTDAQLLQSWPRPAMDPDHRTGTGDAGRS